MASCVVCSGCGFLLEEICPLCDGVPGWPAKIPSIVEMNVQPTLRCLGPHREIRAIHDSETVRVYQAYNAEIADAAVAANSFRAPAKAGTWSTTRISWIKPSAVWMAYRCGWTVMKDTNQARVLALDLSRAGLEGVLMSAKVSDDSKTGECKNYPVVVQWDPERFMNGPQVHTSDVKHMRSIQIGLKGRDIANQTLLNPAFVLRITDVTESFRRAHDALTASPPDVHAAAAALWPKAQEQHMTVPKRLREVLGMDKPMDP